MRALREERPTLRVCLWTAPLVLTTTTETALVLTALYRTCKVVLAVMVDGVVHVAEDFVLIPFVTKIAASRLRAR